MIPVNYYIILSAILFIIGVLGVLIRRNALVVFMSIELMLNAGNLAFVAFARMHQNLNGQIFVFFIMTVAAAEVAVGLGLLGGRFRSQQSIHGDHMNKLTGENKITDTALFLLTFFPLVVFFPIFCFLFHIF